MIDYIRITPEGHIRATDAAPFDYIVSYVPFPDINKMVGDPIALPNTATVTRNSGKVETLIVNWEPVSTEFAGTFDISGSVGNGAGVVVQRVIVSQILTDIDILRQIRDANPTSQLPTLWLDTEDPYTEWWDGNDEVGVLFGGDTRLDQFAIDYDITIPAIAERSPLKAYVLKVASLGINILPNVNKLLVLHYLDCSSSQLTSLDATGLTELLYLDCYFNQLTSLDVTGLSSLKYLDCTSNQLTSLDITGLSSLQQLSCYSNQLTTLNVSGLTALLGLSCYSNQLTTLNVSGLLALQYLICDSNQLTGIPSLVAKGLIISADFTHNLMPPTETDRLINVVGFTPDQVLPQDI